MLHFYYVLSIIQIEQNKKTKDHLLKMSFMYIYMYLKDANKRKTNQKTTENISYEFENLNFEFIR